MGESECECELYRRRYEGGTSEIRKVVVIEGLHLSGVKGL